MFKIVFTKLKHKEIVSIFRLRLFIYTLRVVNNISTINNYQENFEKPREYCKLMGF